MEKNKIFVLIGKSGSGKDTLQNIVSYMCKLHKIVLTTTRPMRDNEVDGEDYLFISNKEFNNKIKNGEIIIYAAYGKDKEWQYGIEKKTIREDENNIVVLSPALYEQLKLLYGEKVVGMVIHYSDKMRLLAALNREDDPDVYEICRRFLADEDDFKDILHDFTLYHIHNKYDDLKYALSQILFVIKA